MLHLTKVRYTYISLFLLASVSTSLAQSKLCKDCYIWEFVNEKGERTETTRMLSDDFEDILSQNSECNVLQRSKLAYLYEQIKNEAAVSSLIQATSFIKDELRSKRAKHVIFGVVYRDFEGNISLRISFENLETTSIKSDRVFLIGETAYNFDKRKQALSKFINTFLGIDNALPSDKVTDEKIMNPPASQTPNIKASRTIDSLIHELTITRDSNPKESKKSKEFRDQGRDHAQSGDYELAVTDFTSAIKLNRKDPILYKNRANAYKNLGQDQNAEIDYSLAIHLKIDDFKVYLNRGHVRLNLGENKAAVLDFTEYIDNYNSESEKNLISAFRGRANAYKHLSEYSKSISDYSEVIDRNKNDAHAYTSRGAMYLYNNQYQEAIIDLTMALKLDNKEIEAYKYRAKAYEALQMYDLQKKDLADYKNKFHLKRK